MKLRASVGVKSLDCSIISRIFSSVYLNRCLLFLIFKTYKCKQKS